MTIPYRTQRVLKQLGLILLAVAILLVTLWLCWFLWVKRYIVYGADGSVYIITESAAAPYAKQSKNPIDNVIKWNIDGMK